MYVKKVQFKLHESYPSPVRGKLSSPPPPPPPPSPPLAVLCLCSGDEATLRGQRDRLGRVRDGYQDILYRLCREASKLRTSNHDNVPVPPPPPTRSQSTTSSSCSRPTPPSWLARRTSFLRTTMSWSVGCYSNSAGATPTDITLTPWAGLH